MTTQMTRSLRSSTRMTKSAIKKRYSGALAKRFAELKLGFGAIPSQASSNRVHKQLVQRWQDKIAKLLQLCDFFEIDLNHRQRWLLLALALAEKHVLGFQEQRKRGARRKWTSYDRYTLKLAVEREIAAANNRGSKGVRWACVILSKRNPWKVRLAKMKKPDEVLRRNYYFACREQRQIEQRQTSERK